MRGCSERSSEDCRKGSCSVAEVLLDENKAIEKMANYDPDLVIMLLNNLYRCFYCLDIYIGNSKSRHALYIERIHVCIEVKYIHTLYI